MARLQHPNVLQLRGACLQQGSLLCLATQNMPGGDLYKALRQAPELFKWQQLGAGIALDIARGLAYLHGLQPAVLHRDVKSPNVLLSAARVAVLGDLGNAETEADRAAHSLKPPRDPGDPQGPSTSGRGAHEKGTGQNSVGSKDRGRTWSSNWNAQAQPEPKLPRAAGLHGLRPSPQPQDVMTPLWSAPEVLNKEPSGAPADIWSLGLLIWELASGLDIAAFPPLGVTSLVAPGATNAVRMPTGAPEAAVAAFEACTRLLPSERATAAHVVEILRAGKKQP